MYTYQILIVYVYISYFIFNNTTTTEIYTLSLHDALPILFRTTAGDISLETPVAYQMIDGKRRTIPASYAVASNKDRKSTRLNSSHSSISYAVFCLKKKTYRRTISHNVSNT